jgi:tagatose 6-phosphate kinase
LILSVTLNPSIDKHLIVGKFVPGSVMRVKEVHNTAGGKGLNVSRTVRLLGEPVTATGFLGGHSGAFVRSLLPTDGIIDAFVKLPGETRSCLNIQNVASSEHTELLEPGPCVPEKAVNSFIARYRQELASCQVVTVSGSIPPGIPVNFYGELVELARGAGKPILLDASGEALIHGLRKNPTMVKPNCEELALLIGANAATREQLAEAIMKLHRGGVALAVVSMGQDGMLAACREGIFHAYPPAIRAYNTVGCGDSMVGGFAVALARAYSVPEAIRLAVAVSAASALCKDTGRFDPADVRALLPLVTIQSL